MWKRLLTPLDGSPLAEHALPYATALARALEARLMLLHVRPTMMPQECEAPDLDAIGDRLRAEGVEVDAHVCQMPRVEDAGRAIVDAASDLRAELIVMATHGRGGLGRVLYGSVTDQVLCQAKVPVMLIPPTCERPWPENRLSRVLVPLDGSEISEAVLAPVGDLVGAVGAELILLRVAVTIDFRLHGDECVRCRLARARGEEPDVEQVRAQRYLDANAARLRAAGLMVETQMQVGEAASTIARIARERNVDLIAMATHGRGGLARLVLGSVATGTLRRADVPLLLVRPAALR